MGGGLRRGSEANRGKKGKPGNVALRSDEHIDEFAAGGGQVVQVGLQGLPALDAGSIDLGWGRDRKRKSNMDNIAPAGREKENKREGER